LVTHHLFLFGSVSSGIGFLIFKKEAPEYRGILTMGSSGYNLGLFAYPLIEGIWGWQGLTYAIMFDLGNSFINFIVNYGMGTYLSALPKKEIQPSIYSNVSLHSLLFRQC